MDYDLGVQLNRLFNNYSTWVKLKHDEKTLIIKYYSMSWYYYSCGEMTLLIFIPLQLLIPKNTTNMWWTTTVGETILTGTVWYGFYTG